MKIALVQFSDGGILKGAGYIAASVLRAGHELRFYDSHDLKLASIADSIIDEGCELMLLSVMTMDMPLAIELVKAVKSKKDIPVLMGGVHPIIAGVSILDEFPQVDYLCIGEGETMVVEFIENIGRPSLFEIKNLAYRKNGKAVVNQIRDPEPLDSLPDFPWHLYSKHRIVSAEGFLGVTTTRGCPYRCTYCCNKPYLDMYGKGYLRNRPLDQVISELLFLKKNYRPKLILFGDEMLLWDRQYAKDLFLAIKEKVGLPFGFEARVEYITDDLITAAKEAGCQYVGMGLECGDEEFRNEHLKRHMSNEQIESAFRRLKAAGMFTTSYNMIGFPFENDTELTNATIELNKKIRPDFVMISIFYPFPGTDLHERCTTLGLIDPTQVNRVSSYYKDSILKGFSLKGKPKEIEAMFDSRRNWNKRWKGADRWPHVALYAVHQILRKIRTT